MAQIFHRSANTLAKVSIVVVALVAGGGLMLVGVFWQSPWVSQQGVYREQPVPFSHKHHVRGLGMDCRYCHVGVETTAYAGVPSTKTCMTCHSQIWTNSGMLAPVREAYQTGQPIRWQRVHNLPQFVYFDHHIHIAKGVACTTCHGPVERMPLMYQHAPLTMGWCLECHRNPEKYVGRKEDVFKSTWVPQSRANNRREAGTRFVDNPGNAVERPHDDALGAQLVKEYHIKSRTKLTDCYTCHR